MTEVPDSPFYRFDKRTNFFYVRVEYFLAAEGLFSFAYFLLDTGSTKSVVTQAISTFVTANAFEVSEARARKGLSLNPFSKRKPSTEYKEIKLHLATGQVEVPEIALPKIKFFGKELSSVKVACVQSVKGDPYNLYNYEGILGADILSRYKVHMDYKSQLLTIED